MGTNDHVERWVNTFELLSHLHCTCMPLGNCEIISAFPLIPHGLAVPMVGPGLAASPILTTVKMTTNFMSMYPILKNFPNCARGQLDWELGCWFRGRCMEFTDGNLSVEAVLVTTPDALLALVLSHSFLPFSLAISKCSIWRNCSVILVSRC